MSEISNLLIGEWSNKAQAMRNPSRFSSVIINIVPLSGSLEGKIFLEQAFSFDTRRPYRIRVLEVNKDKQLIHSYKLVNPDQYANSSRESTLLLSLTESELLPHCPDCDLGYEEIFNEGFRGFSKSKKCIQVKGDTSYYVESEFIVKDQELYTLDRGFSVDTGKQVWGSNYGFFEFSRR